MVFGLNLGRVWEFVGTFLHRPCYTDVPLFFLCYIYSLSFCECVFLRQTSISAEEKDAVHPIEGDHVPAVQSFAELSGCLAHPHVH